MKNIRIIPRLDIKGPNLVKGIHLEGLRIMGKPESFAKYYYESGADELIYIDIVASLYNRNSLLDIVERTAKEIFIPITVGGGIRTIDDMRAILRAGADKVAINTAAIHNPQLIREASRIFGSSTIVVSIEAIKQNDGRYLAFTDNGRERTGRDVLEWARKVVDLGAGEILLTSVDREGTGLGYDVDLVKIISDIVPIPVIASGGAGNMDHITDVILRGSADAVAIASVLHYGFIEKNQKKENSDHNWALRMDRGFSKVERHDLKEIRAFLLKENVPCKKLMGKSLN